MNKEINEMKDNNTKSGDERNISKEKIKNNYSISQRKNINKNFCGSEESNSLMVDNQSTFANINNSTNDNNNISISSISTFCLHNNNNNNNNKNAIINDICLGQNDKIIKELAAELEQSTTKKDEKFKINSNKIEPLNLIKTIQEEKELPDSSSLRDKTEILFLNSNRDNDSTKKTEINNNNSSLNKLMKKTLIK